MYRENDHLKEKMAAALVSSTQCPDEKSLFFTTENFTLLQKTLLQEKYFFLQNLSRLKFLLAFEN